MSYGVGYRCGSYPALLWPWHKPVAAAPIRPQAWEPPYVPGAALEKTKRQKRKERKKRKTNPNNTKKWSENHKKNQKEEGKKKDTK